MIEIEELRTVEDLTRRILGDLIRTQLVVTAAAADGIKVTDAQIDQRLAQIRTQLEAQGQKFEDAVANEASPSRPSATSSGWTPPPPGSPAGWSPTRPRPRSRPS